MVKIKVVILGHFPHLQIINKIRNWKSDLFEIIGDSKLEIVGDADGLNWEYLDENIERQLPARSNEDILIAVTNVPIEENYYARRFSDDRVCISYSGMAKVLNYNNIPIENLLLSSFYSVSLVYRRFGNRIPFMLENVSFTHDETRGCIFDMNGNKTDIIYSTHKPKICSQCIHTLTNNPIAANRIETDLIYKVQSELLKIKKGLYFQIAEFIKRYPIYSIIISSLTAVVLGVIGSLLASFIYEKIK